MTNDIRESLVRLAQLSVSDLAATDNELKNLLAALRSEVEAQINMLKDAESTHPAYSATASDLVTLLQLTQIAVDAKTEVGKLIQAAGKAVAKVLKKAPK